MIVFIIILLVAYIAIASYGLKKNTLNESRFFLISVIPLALSVMLLTDILSMPDGVTHFRYCYSLSNNLLGNDSSDEWMMRNDDWEYYDSILSGGAKSHIDEFTIGVQDDSMVDPGDDYDYMKYYSAFGYLPQVIGITIARLLGLSSVIVMFLPRVIMIVVYLLLCYRAIVRIPFGKKAVMLLSLMPFTLSLASSFSYDAMVYLVTLNFVSCIFTLRYRMSKLVCAEALIFAFLLGAVKGGGYLILLPLVFLLIPTKDKPSDPRSKIWILIGIVLCGITSVVLFDLVIPSGQEFFQLGDQYDYTYPISHVWTHPFEYFWMVIVTYAHNTYETIFLFGETTTGWINFVLMITGLVYSLLENAVISIRRFEKIIIGVVIAVILISIPMMLVGMTKRGEVIIYGLRARYYLPMIPVIFMLACVIRCPKWLAIHEKTSQKLNDNLLYYICCGFSVIGVMLRMV